MSETRSVSLTRREFLAAAASAATGIAAAGLSVPSGAKATDVGASHLPRWRGFNLQNKFGYGPNRSFDEREFAWIADWGFNFVRLPLSYKCWTEEGDWLKLRKDQLVEIDQAVEYGRKHGVHVCLNFHRAPGYCIGQPPEPLDLFRDEEALGACAYHWRHFAKRYQGIPNEQLSFNLVNEPPPTKAGNYARVAGRSVEAIREEDADRLIIADGILGRMPVTALKDLGVAQSTRGYDPMEVTHYNASWVTGADRFPRPEAWPIERNGKTVWDKEALRRRCIAPWRELEASGVGIHVGECGAHNQTPHVVVLAWLHDFLELWQEAQWGWALWNLSGSFGILDSGRADVTYEDFQGCQLDRAMLDLLQAH